MTEHDIPAWTPAGELTALPSSNEIPSELRAPSAAIGKYHHGGTTYSGGYVVGERPCDYGDHPALRRSIAAANDNYPRVVAFTGLAGSGKSTATRYLVERHGYTLVKFAGPLKDMMRAIGFSELHIEGELKEQPDAMLGGKTPRHAMQTLGTEWGRNCIGEDFWANAWLYRARALTDFGQRVVVDDCRFANEAAAIRTLGGVIIKLEGRGGIAGTHQSEAGCGVHDAVIDNSGCVTALYADVEETVRRAA